jgi:glycosyltransferase involved in cell wall biosynthesis
MTKILFLVPYPLKQAPSQRFRFEQYFEVLAETGHELRVQSFLSEKNWRTFYTPGSYFKKTLSLTAGVLKRLYALLLTPAYDFVFIHREAAPLGPPVVEWAIAKVCRKKIIYDFDDAIWITDRTDEPSFLTILKWRTKVATICRWSHKVSCGNNYLCAYAGQYNTRVVLNPTTLDTHLNQNVSSKNKDEVVVGWTGSHSTLKYLKKIEPALQTIEQLFPNVRFLVIADRTPDLKLAKLDFVAWSRITEIEDLSTIDIGIMPLPDDEWANGKCGFKALQYMALEIAAVASPVGVNTQIIQHEKNGLLADTQEQWVHALARLIENEPLRRHLGTEARKTVEAYYSITANTANFVSLFNATKPTPHQATLQEVSWNKV